MVTVVFAHPWHGSFNKAILDTVTKNFDEKGKEYQIIDLNKDNFNPVYTEQEMAVYSRGEHKDPLVGKYQEMIKNSNEMVLIYPIWWGTMPAILKGFFDKVFLKDFAYNYEGGWNPLLKIEKTSIITTSEQETASIVSGAGDSVNVLINNMLPSVGIKNGTWYNCDHTTHGTKEHREAFLESIKNI